MDVTVLVLTPVIVGVVQAIKMTKLVPDNFLPLLDIVLGLVAGLLFLSLTAVGALQGVMAGLAAAGLYDLGKEPVQKVVDRISG